MARPLIARHVVEVALREGANALAHGCTGKGNDQLRFDAVFRTTDLEVIAPMRELSLTREEERRYAAEHGISFERGRITIRIRDGAWMRTCGAGV